MAAITQLDASHWGIACSREPIIRGLAALPHITLPDILIASDKLGLSRSRIYELIARYRETPMTGSLLDLTTGYP